MVYAIIIGKDSLPMRGEDMAAMGVNRDYLKKANRGLALKLIATKQCVSRIELSKAMGLTKTAISTIVGDLMAQGYLVETYRQQTSEPGPNPVILEIGPGAPKFAGVLIQRGYAQAALCDLNMLLEFIEIETCIRCKWLIDITVKVDT